MYYNGYTVHMNYKLWVMTVIMMNICIIHYINKYIYIYVTYVCVRIFKIKNIFLFFFLITGSLTSYI